MHEVGSRPVAILGAGVLGRKIACAWLAGGFNVTIRDLDDDQIAAARQWIDENVEPMAQAFGTFERTRGKINLTRDLVFAAKDASLIIESVPERLDLKISVFEELSHLAPPDCILGSNSSSFKSRLMLGKVDQSIRSRCLNVHYTMPPEIKAVELMTSTYTNESVFSLLVDKHRDIGLKPVVAKSESTGYAGSYSTSFKFGVGVIANLESIILGRLWAAVKREALTILSESVTNPEDLDAVWLEMFQGNDRGPCKMMDAVGLDTVKFIEENYIAERGLDKTTTTQYLEDNYISQGKLGSKSAAGGFYQRQPQQREDANF